MACDQAWLITQRQLSYYILVTCWDLSATHIDITGLGLGLTLTFFNYSRRSMRNTDWKALLENKMFIKAWGSKEVLEKFLLRNFSHHYLQIFKMKHKKIVVHLSHKVPIRMCTSKQ